MRAMNAGRKNKENKVTLFRELTYVDSLPIQIYNSISVTFILFSPRFMKVNGLIIRYC
jgi:hypothetical protein